MLESVRRHRAVQRLRKRIARRSRRARFFQGAAKYVPYLGVDSAHGIYFVSTSDSNVGRSLFLNRGERKEHSHLDRALAILESTGHGGRRDVLLDVGANIGTTVVQATRDHGFARAVAYEPEAENFRLLRLNVLVNDLDERVAVHRVALSDVSGTVSLDTSSSNSGGYRVLAAADAGRTVEVPAARLDDLLAEDGIAPGEVDLVWMDVEGHEPHVLAGAPKLLERAAPLVLELCPKHLARSQGLDLLLGQLARTYALVYDLRRPEAAPVAADDLGPLVERYATSFTDVLAVAAAPS